MKTQLEYLGQTWELRNVQVSHHHAIPLDHNINWRWMKQQWPKLDCPMMNWTILDEANPQTKNHLMICYTLEFSNDESVIKDINQTRLQEITKVREETCITMKWHWNEENVQENDIEMKRMSKTNSKGM